MADSGCLRVSQILVNKASGDSVLQVLGNKARKNCQIVPVLPMYSSPLDWHWSMVGKLQGGANLSCDFLGGKTYYRVPLQNYFWKPQKVSEGLSGRGCKTYQGERVQKVPKGPGRIKILFTTTVVIHNSWGFLVIFPRTKKNRVFQRPCHSVVPPSNCFAITVLN